MMMMMMIIILFYFILNSDGPNKINTWQQGFHITRARHGPYQFIGFDHSKQFFSKANMMYYNTVHFFFIFFIYSFVSGN